MNTNSQATYRRNIISNCVSIKSCKTHRARTVSDFWKSQLERLPKAVLNFRKIIHEFHSGFSAVLFILGMLALFPGIAFAADISIISKESVVGIGEFVHVQVSISSEQEAINAVEGSIVFPADLLELSRIEDGNSTILFWLERPKERIKGELYFSGIIPGGYQKSDGNVFQLVFKVRGSGKVTIQGKDMRVLKNDGDGTLATVTISPATVTTQLASTHQAQDRESEDTDPPEPFTVEVVQDTNLFNNAWFLVFATQDKGVGVDRYEICEGKTCTTGDSPYPLQNQKLSDTIIVRAIDKNGNERIAKVPGSYTSTLIIVLAVAIVVCIIIFLRNRISKLLWRR